MASPAPQRPTSPGAPASGTKSGPPSVPPPPTSGTPRVAPPPIGGGARGTAIQISATPANTGQPGATPSAPQGGSPQHQPSRSSWLKRAALFAAPIAVGAVYLFLQRGQKADTGQPSTPTTETKPNTYPPKTYPLQASLLTQEQRNEILSWKNQVPIAPASGDLYGKVPDPDKWLEKASKLNSLLVLKIRSQIDALNSASTNKGSLKSDAVDALQKDENLKRAFHITYTSKWVGSGDYPDVAFVRDISNELTEPRNAHYKTPTTNGIRYMKTLTNTEWPQRWPEYVIERLDGLVKLHEALLGQESKK